MSKQLTSRAEFDIVAIGGGTAGLVTAAGAAGLGATSALIERDRLGGDCLWTGCVPSKALIGSAHIAHVLRTSSNFGIAQSAPEIDGARILESVRDIRAQIQKHDDPERFRRLGVDVIEGEGRFISRNEVEVGDRRVRARRFVIATGSRAAVPPIPGLKETGFYTHETAFDRDSIPTSVAIIGGGAIGVEFAQAYRRLGVEVTLIEMLERLLIKEEPDLALRLQTVLEAEGIRVLTGVAVKSSERVDGKARLTLASHDSDAGPTIGSVEADEVLVATGRRPNVEGIGLETAGIEFERWGVKVDERLRTSQKHIFAAGDVTGGLLFTHVADHEARTVLQNALFPVKAKIKYDVIPWCTFSDPELARVGLTEEEARDQYGDSVRAVEYDLENLDRAITERAAFGCVKIVTTRSGRILGGHILGPSAGSLIAEVALAMKHGIKLGAISSLVHAYPTMSEGVRRAADTYRRSTLKGWRKTALSLALGLGRRIP